jgi:predicted ester cyclase
MRKQTFGRMMIWSMLLVAGALAAATAAAGEAENRALITEYVEDCLNDADDRCLDRYLLAEKVAAIRKSEQLRHHYFPDLHYRVIEVVADEDRVVAMLEVTGHREGTEPAAGGEGESAASGDGDGRLRLREALFYSVRDGKLYDGELISDRLAVAQALGYSTEPPPQE